MKTHIARYIALASVFIWVGITLQQWGTQICTTGAYTPNFWTMLVFLLQAPVLVWIGFCAGRESEQH